MQFIRTVTGDILPTDLGSVDAHQHLFIRGGMAVDQYPDWRLNDFEKAKIEVLDYLAAGGRSLVEMSPIDWGRDAVSLQRLSTETGAFIVAATGFHKLSYYSDIHWLYDYSDEEITSLIVGELVDGMDTVNYSGPLVKRTTARAGVIKFGSRRGSFNPTEVRLLNCVAQAHLRTGAPVITHTDDGELALEQARALLEYGVKPNSIAICHVDRCNDLNVHAELARLGIFLEYDSATRVNQGRDKTVRDLVVRMFDLGYSNQILLGGDMSRQSYWTAYGGTPGLRFMPSTFRSKLAAAGLDQCHLHRLYVTNPAAFLSWKPRSGV